ncbi:MAG TPA: ferritin-like protein [Ktedonobacterales bacterium]|nr:ferritin-like protein [Ktedonobacterales bacterium]
MAEPLVVTTREELIFLLCEASELEHLLMCEYLFAALSMKETLEEGLTPEQLDAVRRWERTITEVAVQEMLHLAQASNLLTAIGGMPHFRRPNLPQRAKYYPPEVQLALMPFSEDALRHFIFLERPEDFADQDAPEFKPVGVPFADVHGGELVPVAQNFATVGLLYRAIEQGMLILATRYGEEQLFVGPTSAQATGDYFHWPELVAVTDLLSAGKAVEFIVEQGEGARGDWRESHYGRFLKVLEEYLALKQGDPSFEPARPTIPARVRLPRDVAEGPLISDMRTAAVADLFNGCYEVLIEVLLRFFVHEGEGEAELAVLSDVAVGAMFTLMAPLGRLLTRLPVGAEAPGKTAGPTFDIFRRSYLLPYREAAWVILRERLLELAEGCVAIGQMFPAEADAAAHTTLGEIERSLRTLAEAFVRHSG